MRKKLEILELDFISGMESEEVMTSSVTSNSSDNESWTIIEDELEDTNPLAQARIDVIQAVAEFSKRQPISESESDIEPIAEEEAETNLESLNSDGIPLGEELSDNGDQYLWSSEGTELTSSTETIENKEVANDALCPSGYPPEELMDRFAEITKGRTYLHQPNQALNLYLTGTLVIVFSLVLGLGFGHFKGWSERLELQEQYADVREERMDELTDSLVSCMTSSQDDQDLDDQVIRQLRDENDRLKSELQLLRNTYDLDNSANEEMNAILRDRINHLLTAKADLEKEVVKLRYSAPEIIEETPMETKESMNRMAHENEQLKIAIGKERYGPRQVPVEAKVQLNMLQTENDELKTEVRKFRYGVHDLSNPEVEMQQNNTDLMDDDDDIENIEVENDEPNFVTLGKVQPVLPPVILLGGKLEEVEIPDEEDEGFVEDFDDATEECAHEEEEEDELELLQPVQEVVEELAKTAQELLIPDKSQLEQAAKAAQDLGHSIKQTWTDDKFDIKDKLSETLNKVYNKAHDWKSESSEIWNQRAEIVQDKFQKIHQNWNKVQQKIDKKVKSKWNDWQKDLKSTWKSMEDQLGKVQDKYWNKKKKSKENHIHASAEEKKKSRKSQDYSSWSKKNSSMIFARAKNRDKLRKEHTRSDWLFERANDRKRHQKLLTDAEWYNRRSFSKHCDDDGCKTIDEVSQFFKSLKEFPVLNKYLSYRMFRITPRFQKRRRNIKNSTSKTTN